MLVKSIYVYVIVCKIINLEFRIAGFKTCFKLLLGRLL
jgi:hypothetical protein